jgi:hypothetical protein
VRHTKVAQNNADKAEAVIANFNEDSGDSNLFLLHMTNDGLNDRYDREGELRVEAAQCTIYGDLKILVDRYLFGSEIDKGQV